MPARDPRYDILFEPVAIGPVTAKNRFYQVPHCTGMGWLRPRMVAGLRGVKAEGGWGVVCTEEVEIHPNTETEPFCEGRLWDDNDIAYHALTCDAIQNYGDYSHNNWIARMMMPIIGFRVVLRQMLHVRHLERVELAALTVSACVETAWAAFTIPEQGGQGSAVAMIVAEAIFLLIGVGALASGAGRYALSDDR